MRKAAFLLLLALALPVGADNLESGFAQPPNEAKPRVWWLWLHTHISKSRITYELEQMKKQGIGGLLQWDPGPGPSRYGTRAVELPKGPAWMTPEWRGALLHTFREADRLGLDVAMSLSPGANCGGPWITPEMSAKRLVFGSANVIGPVRYSAQLPLPEATAKGADGKPLYYRDLAVFAAEFSRVGQGRPPRELANLAPLHDPANVEIGNPWINITKYLAPDGTLNWDVPAGAFRILRIGYTSTGQAADYFGHQGLYADHMNAQAVEFNFRTMFDELFGKGPLPKSLKYVHCDSYEVYNSDWTANLVEEFRKRRGYDPTPWLPTLDAGAIETRALTARFQQDMNRTRSDCFFDHHYDLIRKLAHERGIGWHSEAAGPSVITTDWLQMLGANDIPMGEFWLRGINSHRVTEEERFYVKAPATAAHVYGKRWVAAEAFTSIGGHWEEDPWRMKPDADQAFLEGVNRVNLHTFSHSPDEFGKPGIEYFAGTHINPNITWWDQSHAWFDYLARCQYLLSQGLFVADVLYYNGDQVPNWVQMKHVDARLGRGYDYDVANTDVVLNRLSVRDGRLVLPDGMSYRVLVLPEQKAMPVEVLTKLGELARAGATIIGPAPTEASGLTDYRARDAAVQKLAGELWGQGWIRPAASIRETLAGTGTPADAVLPEGLDYLHRQSAEGDFYFVVNKLDRPVDVAGRFRVTGKAPEFWDPATGERYTAGAFREEAAHTAVPLRLDAYGSVFVVFRQKAGFDAVESVSLPAELRAAEGGQLRLRSAVAGVYELRSRSGRKARVAVKAVPAAMTVATPWTVRFTPGWGAPESAEFPRLVSWSERPEEGIRHYSGAGAYTTTFDAPGALLGEGVRTWLDLGEVKNLAEVRLNGKDLGVLWKPPFRVDVTGLLQAKANRLEVKVVNLWPNRMIGDETLGEAKRFTHSNMYKFTAGMPLWVSGLLGPVRVVPEREVAVGW
jgi:hypothetical protein